MGDTFSARLKQSSVSVQVARVAADNWFKSCGLDTINDRRPYLAVYTVVSIKFFVGGGEVGKIFSLAGRGTKLRSLRAESGGRVLGKWAVSPHSTS